MEKTLAYRLVWQNAKSRSDVLVSEETLVTTKQNSSSHYTIHIEQTRKE